MTPIRKSGHPSESQEESQDTHEKSQDKNQYAHCFWHFKNMGKNRGVFTFSLSSASTEGIFPTWHSVSVFDR